MSRDQEWDYEIWEEDDLGCCEHGVGFDEDCEACGEDPVGCLYPEKCLMPGFHLESECHTADMIEKLAAEMQDGEY